ncbi:MAG: hypothetical protein P4L76_13345 [Beijerinckiaceae bacterium]|nr:hypothetical protein [Beijerinckiaceae bacterium]
MSDQPTDDATTQLIQKVKAIVLLDLDRMEPFERLECVLRFVLHFIGVAGDREAGLHKTDHREATHEPSRG